jgi:C-terminal processing protease CtpA/Prc
MRRVSGYAVLAALLVSGCGGGGSNSGQVLTSGGSTAAPSPSPTPSPASCSLPDRQSWVLNQMKEWYLFSNDLAANANPSAYNNIDDYIDALTAPARAQNKDRYFTYITSITQENAYYNSGASAGFGLRFSYDTAARRAYVTEAFEGASGLAAGIDRGDEILEIGDTPSTMQSVSAIMAASGAQGVVDALGPSTAGTTRTLRVSGSSGTRTVTVAKSNYTLQPVSSRYGSRVLTVDGRKIGYLNLRTFIDTAETPLRNAFANFRAQGITEFVIDLRYNGGGLVAVSELMGDLLGGNRGSTDVYSRTTYRPEKSARNTVHYFAPTGQSVSPVRIAFIGTGGTASASEMVINGMYPWLGNDMALIGTNTYGKPVGQTAIDRTACDDRLRVIAFAVSNAANVGDYYTGLAPKLSRTCAASDDINYPLGDPREASIARAIDFLSGRTCTSISAAQNGATASTTRGGFTTAPRELLQPLRPDTTQREVPGSF